MLGTHNDGRRKLTQEDKENIIKMFNQDKMCVREIARAYEKKCSRRLIQFVLFPERLKTMQERNRKERKWTKYYDKEKHKIYMRKHREKLKRVGGVSEN